MPNLEDCQHDLLLIIATTLFVLLITGLGGPLKHDHGVLPIIIS